MVIFLHKHISVQ